jgi:uncharacterized protein YcbX
VRLSEITVYPVKSTRGTSLIEAVVEPWGLAQDRRWMVLDAKSDKINVQRYHQLQGITATPTAVGLHLAAPGIAPLSIDVPVAGEPVSVSLSRVGHATSAGAAADSWMSTVLGFPARLVWLDDPTRRSISAKHGGKAGDTLSLADTGPLLLGSAVSMAQLNDWIAETAAERDEPEPEPLTIARFRPNVVVAGDVKPFAEDGWAGIRIGEVEFRASERCDRCATTNIDPETLQSGKEPIRTLARHRKWDGSTWFGVRLVPVNVGVLRVGDPVTPLD